MTSSESRLNEAIQDYKFLLNRGYSRQVSLYVLTSRYLLSEEERLILYRCVHSDQEIARIKKREEESKNDSFKKVLVDGFNLAFSVISLSFGEAYTCDDGYIRDVGMGKFKKEKNLIISALTILNELCFSMNKECTFVLDAQVSKSGEIAKHMQVVGARTVLSKTVDSFLINSDSLVASNDFLILMKAKRIINLLSESTNLAKHVIDINSIKFHI
ncbi:DUF434 domain-containing protein [Sulfuracidifex tepidarius]|uniref:DUF434 domain-containing protein n=1 Tax=Sulfuracidifex tepidarius TaxID=1294262 RepID=A0A510DUP7_9CREN|nr:DUF434 domain-containing protein [Sulfuracidifex tepidarius]BBG23899.1 hypothetical protein IC006_1197 [Sulfuracidifex tepidarius]BBG26654.1 hypothetical protein IC007_1172 [Sulfuracidifex tepidarius]